MRMIKLAALTASAFALGSCDSGTSLGGFDLEQSFTIGLNSASEVPAPNPTTATGTAAIDIFGATIEYSLSATNITGITMAHIHDGAPGVAGPILVTLFLATNTTGAVNGVFVTGTLTALSLPNTITLESLKARIAAGNTYVNVHTVANPAGEIRGQIR